MLAVELTVGFWW